jgi:transposase
VVADKAYNTEALRQYLIERGILPVISNKDDRKFLHPFDPRGYKWRGTIERMFCRLKDFRRIATRYDKLARNYLASLCLAAIVTFWLR